MSACLPRRTPCWKLDMRPRMASAERGGNGNADVSVCSCALGAAEPGTRCSFGLRLGSPALVVVVFSGVAVSSASAACHPSSPGEVHADGSGFDRAASLGAPPLAVPCEVLALSAHDWPATCCGPVSAASNHCESTAS